MSRKIIDAEAYGKMCGEMVAEMDKQRRAAKDTKEITGQKKVKLRQQGKEDQG